MTQVDDHVVLRHHPLQLLIVAPAENVDAQRRSVALDESLKIGHIGAKVVGRSDDGVVDAGCELWVGREALDYPVDLPVRVDVSDREQANAIIRPSIAGGE